MESGSLRETVPSCLLDDSWTAAPLRGELRPLPRVCSFAAQSFRDPVTGTPLFSTLSPPFTEKSKHIFGLPRARQLDTAKKGRKNRPSSLKASKQPQSLPSLQALAGWKQNAV